ncbi:MerR family transcriptional regulator [Ktedonobacter racemifer]|uniref:Transcriptional regulator, MerR family n=1 Tax=Ktedonobacter racemifer DSM 44963 TaxID=485913 RepID=D6U453_KTERA|nr:MerR family transcriptional regulator [Ktedonobacter racemifer]EFH81283.1 transcriptional regulator, MerR family [Ktedonobacter racemifer DSM 44963]
MQISELASRTGVSLRSLRYYEAKGLLSAQRLENGYRSYGEEDVDRVHLIQQFLNMGLTTDQIYQSGLHRLPGTGENFVELIGGCLPAALSFYEQKLVEMEQKIEILNQAKTKLSQVVATLRNRAVSTFSAQ